ncbi:MAG: acyltransferase [Beijerinckiaceae bacterium]|nr:acyltransferase [Beijerinckiaceae bacterium]
MKFRGDINALRAFAVTAVVLYHYKVNFIPGGFVGVDVFFVISGYLMTAIITGRMAKGRFSIGAFYYDRAKRIIPGLCGLCFVLLAAGYFVLDPAAYKALGSMAIAALLFFSNFQFWQATNYFDPESCQRWLLHTWSLSVEWQFYLLYPIILLALRAERAAWRFIVPILWLMTISSFALCVWSATYSPASAFYLLPQRAWELLAGGIVALQFGNAQRKHPGTLIGGGLAAIGAAVFAFDTTMAWPSYWALLPVIGTCLIISANKPDAFPFKNQIIQAVGKWSYSIYLWHWPIAAAAVYFYFAKTTALKIACELLVLAAIIALGGLLLSIAAKEWNRRIGEARPRMLAGGTGVFGLLLGFAITVSGEGLPNRRPDIARELENYAAAAQDWSFPKECIGTDPAGNLRPCRLGAASGGVLFLGDSFAMHIYGRFAEAAKRNPDLSFTFLASLGCPPVTGMRMMSDPYRCNGFFEKALQFAEARQFQRIVLAARWYAYFTSKDGWMCFESGSECRLERDPSSYFARLDAVFDALRGRLQALKDRGAEIVILGSIPGGQWNFPSELAKRKFLGIDTEDAEYIDRYAFEKNAAAINVRLNTLASATGGKFIDPLNFLCDGNKCPTVDDEGVPYYIDKDHLRASAVKTARFQFLDDAAGIGTRLSAARNRPEQLSGF